MFDFGLYTQVSDSGPLGPLVCCPMGGCCREVALYSALLRQRADRQDTSFYEILVLTKIDFISLRGLDCDPISF